MKRLPINFLLYLISIGLAAGCAWTFYQTMSRGSRLSNNEIFARSKERIERGRGQTPDDQRDEYAGAAQEWWLNFRDTNFIGKLPEKVVIEDVTETAAPEPVASLTPIEEILDVVFIAYSSAGDSRCVVRYKPTANVQPPLDAVGGAPSKGSPYAGPGDVGGVPQPRRARPGRPGAVPQANPMPTFAGEEALVHILAVGDPLWPPYEHIALERVDESGASVYFRRAAPGGEGPVAEKEERVFRNELGLTKEVMEALADGGIRVAGLTERSGDASPEVRPSGESRWEDVPETKKIRGEWHISKQDNEMLSTDAQEVFNQDIGLRSYTSSSGRVQGLQVTKISPRLQRFGVESGDVIIELNGAPVTSKAQALKIGKQQYKTGVREFRAKILRYGKIEERVYLAPK